ncbi:conserved membrane protein of unknown function [Bartonella clarridgeiae 73]|uniref:DUF2062 domain-containing protein n=1 Tax=Bartonella clarridgeiae (strain CCUG 45776 / CIP 104772 / 73) TaxID=696125 RepID=E6YH61_BARC7|nr:DUF2062 domain-containing protein [Bartonella clarridgeiae]CBI76199.1 conserved membrane protein of unknown function [Bartonella clarridgeiae 73]
MFFSHRTPMNFGERVRRRFFLCRLFIRSFYYMRKRILRISATPHKVALGFSIGIFSACSPFLGLHIILAIFFSWVLRGNFAAAIIGTVFSNPLTFLFIVMADYKIGRLFLLFFGNRDEISFSQIRTMFHGLTFSRAWPFFLETWDLIMMPMLVGGMFLGFIFGSLSYIGVYRTIIHFQKNRCHKMVKKRCSK